MSDINTYSPKHTPKKDDPILLTTSEIDEIHNLLKTKPKPKSKELSSNLEIKLKKLNHLIDIENQEAENVLRSCCGTRSDKRLLILASSFSMSAIVLGFSFFKLVHNLDCNEQHAYISLVSLVAGIWLKSPLS